MEVKLAAITENPERFIAYIARVSNPDNQSNPDYAKLIKFLIKNKHFSPFEHASMTVEIKTSRAIAAQILRHRSFTFQEFSQRYSEVTEFEPIEIRKQAIKNRQSSLEVFNPTFLTGFFTYAPEDTEYKNMIPQVKSAEDLILEHQERTIALYKQLLEAGVAKEVARMVLPLNTQTTIYMTGTIRSWIHYIDLRTKDDVQKEHRDVAMHIKALFDVHLPTVSTALYSLQQEQEQKELLWSLLMKQGYVDVSLSDIEMMQDGTYK